MKALVPALRLPVVVVLFTTCTGASPSSSSSSPEDSESSSLSPNVTAQEAMLLAGTAWKLRNVDGRDWPVGNESDVTLAFDEKRLGGFTGCNNFSARWRMTGNKLMLNRVASTMALCGGETGWVEDRLLLILSASPIVDSDGAELRLTALPEGVLTFVAS
jgi:heat shock protein HslJ